jgi:hypothetical protein
VLAMLISRGWSGNASLLHIARIASKTSPNQRSSFASSCLRSAAPAIRGPPKVKVPVTKKGLNLPRSRPGLPEAQSRKSQSAEQMFEVGETALYKTPSHFWYIIGSWAMGLGCIASSAYMIELGLWKEDPNSNLPFFVPIGYKLSIITTFLLANWILFRSTRLVTAIDLVKQAGVVRMRVCVRRIAPLPFLPPRRLYIAPYNLQIPKSAIRSAEVPKFARMPREDSRSNSLMFGTWAAKKVSFSLWKGFAAQRQIWTHEGFLKASIKGQTGHFKIDLEGQFPNGARNFVDVSGTEED